MAIAAEQQEATERLIAMASKSWPAVVLLFAVGLISAVKAGAAEDVAAAKTTVNDLSLDPATAKTLTPEQARHLTASAGALLSLPCLQTISEEAALELATYREESGTCTHTVCVPYTDEIIQTYTVMESYAEEIVRDDGTKASVNKCRPVQKSRTVVVRKCRQEERSHVCPLTLQLDALTTATPEVLAALAKHDGHLDLNGLKSLMPDGAKALAQHKAGTLVLDGLSSLDANVAEQLAARGGRLSLNGITALSLDAAKALCTHKGDLSLDGLLVLDDDLAAVIATHEGSASLKGVKEASEQAITNLRGKPVALPLELMTANTKESQ